MPLSLRNVSLAVLCAGVGFVVGRLSHRAEIVQGRVEVLTRIDTVRVERPSAVASQTLPTVVERLVEVHSRDTVYVEVPRAQTVYESADYRAYVSGFRASLDSITVYRRHSIASVKRPSSRFSVGIQGGCGITPKGFQPYIGIGVSVRLLDF